MTVKIETKNRFVDYDLAFTKVGNAPSGGVGGYAVAFKRDINAIGQSLQNLILTRRGEKPFIPEFGTSLLDILFDTFGPSTVSKLNEEVRYAIANYEPRVQFLSFTPNEKFIDSNNILFDLKFRLVGDPVDANARTVVIELVRAR